MVFVFAMSESELVETIADLEHELELLDPESAYARDLRHAIHEMYGDLEMYTWILNDHFA